MPECCRPAVLPSCRAAVPCCCPGIQADTALDVSAQAYRQTPRWTAANLPHEVIRVRCDVSGSCLSKLCCAPITRCKAGLGAVATDEPRAPPHASVRKINLFQKKSTPRAFRGKVPQKRQAVCLKEPHLSALRTTPVRSCVIKSGQGVPGQGVFQDDTI
jgi:hypothetical protein